MPSIKCAHEASSGKKAYRIQNLVTFAKSATTEHLTSRLIEVWADPLCSITDARILLTLGANPTQLYSKDYGERVLSERRASGSRCASCSDKFDEFLQYAQLMYDAQFAATSIASAADSKATTGSVGSGKENTVGTTTIANGPSPKTTRSTKVEDTVGQVALSLDGGGMRGLASIVCLLFTSRRIFGDESLPSHVDWYVGCSTGAILALALAKGYTLTQCFFLYWEMKNEIFLDKSTMKRLFGNIVDKQTVRMDAVMERVFGSITFGECVKRITVPTLNVQTTPGKLHTFRNYLIRGITNEREVTFRDAARASSAAPTYFHAHLMGDAKYVDGSLVANCPLTILFREYDKCRQAGENLRLACVLSIGTGEPFETVRRYASGNSFSHRGRHILDMGTLLMEQVVGHEKSAIECTEDRCIASEIPFFRISPVGVKVRIDQIDDGKLMDMIWETLKYLLNSLDYIDQVGATLRSIHEEKKRRKKVAAQHRRSQSSINFYGCP